MATEILGLNDNYIDLVTEYTAAEINMVHGALDYQSLAWLRVMATQYPNGVVLKVPNATSWAVSNAGVISPGAGVAAHPTYKAVFLQTLASVTVNDATTGFTANATGLYLFAVVQTGAQDSRKTKVPAFAFSDSPTMNGGILIASGVATNTTAVTAAADARPVAEWTDIHNLVAEATVADTDELMIYDASAATNRKMTREDFLAGVNEQTVPTGTGFRHVTSGTEDGAAKLVENADVAAGAAIAETKLALASDAAAGTASRRTLGTGATQAAAGNHSHSNATTSTAGFMSAADKLKTDNATADATASTLALRDPNGRMKVATPAVANDVANMGYVDGVAVAGAPDASTTTKGITRVSVAPATATIPIAVGDNDPRVTAFGGAGASHSSGLVPDPGATAGATRFLREDGGFAVPPTGSLAVAQSGQAAINNVDLVTFSGATVADNGSGDVTVTIAAGSTLVEALNFIIDGGGAAITTGIKGDFVVPYACVIQSVTLLADATGSIVLDLWKEDYSAFPPTVADTITGSAKPTISAATKSQDTTLTGWSTSILAGQIIRVNVDSASTLTRVTLSLKVIRT